MLTIYRSLKIENLTNLCGLSTPIPSLDHLDLDSKAVKLMVDFYKIPPVTANQSMTVHDALALMRANRIRALMVMNHDDVFAGIVTAIDLMGRKPIAYANEAGVLLSEVEIKDIMLPKTRLMAITRYDVLRSRIGDILQTFKSLNQQHIPVIDGTDINVRVCGLFSASDFKRALNMALDPRVSATTFAQLERVINKQKEVV